MTSSVALMVGFDKPAYGVREIVARRLLPNTARTRLLSLIKSGAIAAKWDGRGWVVSAAALAKYLDHLPDSPPADVIAEKAKAAATARAARAV